MANTSFTYDFSTLGTSGTFVFHLPLTTGTLSTINWGDGNTTVPTVDPVTGLYIHTYTLSTLSTPSAVVVTAIGTFTHMTQYNTLGSFPNDAIPSAAYLKSCTSIQNLITNFDHAFYYCSILDTITAVPTSIASMEHAFNNAIAFNGNIGSWDVSSVTSFSNTFYNATAFEGLGLENWTIHTGSNVVFESMFSSSSAFNTNIGLWDVSYVVNFSEMFYYATAFQGLGIENWTINTTNTVTMYGMFWGASVFNVNIGGWDVIKVTNFVRFLQNATTFNGNLGGWYNKLATSNANFNSMFKGATAFEGLGLDIWILGNNSNMTDIFSNTAISIPQYDAILTQWAVYNSGLPTTYSAKNKIYSSAAYGPRTTFLAGNTIGAEDLGINLNYPFPIYAGPFDVTYNNVVTSGNTYNLQFNTVSVASKVADATDASNKSIIFNVPQLTSQYPTPLNVTISDASGIYVLTDADLSDACFNEGTQILYMNKQMVDEYIRIELLRPGDFVKTFKHGYRKIDMIGRNVLINNPNIYSKCMYKMEKTDTNGLIEDLIVTGGHSILVDSITDEERVLNDELFWGPTPMLDKKYLLLAAVSKQFKPMKNKKPYIYYHLVLDNEDEDEARYGIWANGILTETPSKEYFKKTRLIPL